VHVERDLQQIQPYRPCLVPKNFQDFPSQRIFDTCMKH
jgi:hypothetical protein